MPDDRRVKCRLCKRRVEEAGAISWRGLCSDCGAARLVENIDGLHYKRGLPLQRWRQGMAACVGATIPEKP